MNPTRIFEILDHQLKNNPLECCLSTKKNGLWINKSTLEFYEMVNQITFALLKLGVKPNEKIALISSTNRTEWSVIDMGILQLGAITVPLYPNISSNDYEFILNHSESTYCFVSDKEIYLKLASIKKNVKGLKGIYSFDKISGCKNWLNLIELGNKNQDQHKLNKYRSNISDSDVATIIYTSGTTGIPKGVMLTHKNIVSNVISASKKFPFKKKQIALSFLPLCHIFERTFVYGYMYNGISVNFAESLDTISENLMEVKPNFMTAVPRLLEKVYEKIYNKGNEFSGLKKKIFFWSIKVALKFEPYNNNLIYLIKHWIAKKLVLSKWKNALGGKLELICSGSAPLQPRLARVFSAAGITIAEAYGLTETSPAISINELKNKCLKIGTVGKPIENVEIKIANDGEILCKGPNVMKGYYKDPKLTKKVMSGGFFHTGDIGLIDNDGFLKVTDRKKQIFKTSGGKYIAPQVIENYLKQSNLIEQIIVIGEGKKMPAALIQPNFDQARLWMKQNSIPYGKNLEDISKNLKLIEKITIEIRTYDKNFGSWERVKAIKLTPDIWSIEGGHLTPTMKVKRKAVISKYQFLINEIYN